ncbi:MAG: hypothetical protein IH963_10230 [Chloroflexi bacterium]|nr:hypothetical protein [Chloroflexota bacterium]
MPLFDDSLRGYAYPTHQRDNFVCTYCGLDGKASLDSWLTLSWDHLLPKGHPDRDNPEFIVTACNFCNTADNRYFDLAEKRGLVFDGMSRDELVAQRKPYVFATRNSYKTFWDENVGAKD